MHEGPIRFGSAKPELTKQKRGFKETIRRAFTVKGAEDAWQEKYADEICQITEVTTSLPEEQRQLYLDQFENDAKKGAVRKVIANYALATTAVAGVTFAGFLVGNEGFRQKVGRVPFVGPPLEWVGQRGADALRAAARRFRKSAEPVLQVARRLEAGEPSMGLREYLGSLHIDALDALNERFPVGHVVPQAIVRLLRDNLETTGARDLTYLIASQAYHFGK